MTTRLSALFLALCGLACLLCAFALRSVELECIGTLATLGSLVSLFCQPETKSQNN